MNRIGLGFILMLAMLAVVHLNAQDQYELLKQKIGQVKQSIAQNQASLRQYSWVETTEISLKREVKKREYGFSVPCRARYSG